MKPGKTGIERLIDATRYSLCGLRECFRHEAAFRLQVIIIALLLPLSVFIARSTVQWLILVGPLILLLVIELLNSAVEAVVDRIGHEWHELSGRAKDMGSAAVFLCMILIILCWGGLIFANYF
jgi:diacylglycerol kinase (ATP)